MARIKYFIKGKSKLSTVYVRFSYSREINLKKSTSLQVRPTDFNNKTGEIKINDNYENNIKLKDDLEQLKDNIISKFNIDYSENIKPINQNWLGNVITETFRKVTDEDDPSYLVNFSKKFIKALPTKVNPNGKYGCSESTIKKYTTILHKVSAFQEFKNTKFFVKDFNIKFRDEFLDFLLNEQKLSRNTTGRYIKALKTIVLDAKKYGIQTHYQLEAVKGFSVKVEKITLSFDEIKQIEACELNSELLEGIRDWLIIGCYIGQRISDLLILTKKNIVTQNGYSIIELKQKKTNKNVSILIHPKVQKILNKYNGNFPPSVAETYYLRGILFNKYIRQVTLKSGLTKEIKGGKWNAKIKRKDYGIFPKWKLVTSHICRRSFATNFYGDVPTPLLINITGHSSEKEFLNYIGKASIDYAEQLAKYWN